MSNETSARDEGESGPRIEQRWNAKGDESWCIIHGAWIIGFGAGDGGRKSCESTIRRKDGLKGYTNCPEFTLLMNPSAPPEAKPEPLPNTLDVERAENWLKANHDVLRYAQKTPAVRVLAEVLHDYSLTVVATPNTLQEEQSLSYEVRKQLWLTHGCGIACLYGDDGEMQCGRFRPFIDFRRDGEAAILEGIEVHCQKRWSEVQSAAPKVVDSKEGRCQTILTLSNTQCRREEGHEGDHVGNFNDTSTKQSQLKVEEQDGEQDDCPRCNHPWDRHKGRCRYQPDMSGECGCRAKPPSASEIKHAESVAPPSLPKQEFEAWWDEEIRLAQIHLGSGDYWVSKGIANKSWNASRAAAPVALPTHQIVSSNIVAVERSAELRCSCGRIFVGLGDEALASSRASFEAHLPEKEGK